MNILDNFLGKIGLAKKANGGFPSISDFAGADPFSIWRSGKKISAEKAMEVFTGWVYGSVRSISEDIGFMKFKLYKIKSDETMERQYQHDLLDLLEAPNQSQIGFNFRYKTAAHLEMVGNAYWLLTGVKDEGSKPQSIRILNPKFLKIETLGEFPDETKRFKYTYKNKIYTFQPHEIIHFEFPDPNDDVEGIGTVQTCAQWIDSDNYASEFNRRFFLNGARIGGLLESEHAKTPEQLDYLKKSFEAIYKGVENAYKVAALPAGTTFKEVGQSQKDMDFIEGQKSSRDKILSGFRVPKTILGTAESETNRATAETADYVFASRTIKPKMQLLCAYLNIFLVPRFGDDLYLDFEDPVPENRELRIQEMTAATGGQPVISVNEARDEYFGLEGVENGDDVMTDFSKQPLGAPIKSAEKPKIKTGSEAKPSIRYNRVARKKQEISSSIAQKAVAELADLETKATEILKKDITTLSDDEYEVVWKRFITRVTPYEKAQAEAVRKFNGEQKKEVLDNLSSAIKSKAVDEERLFDLEKAVTGLMDLSSPIIIELFGKEGTAAAELLGIDAIDILTPAVRQSIERSLELMSKKYNQATLDLLKAKLEQGMADGLGLEELKDTVSQVYEFSDEVRAERVAKTEVFRAANGGTHEAWRATGVVKSIKWYTAADERVCPYCEQMHGEVVGIDEKFFEKGDSVTGTDGSQMSLDYSDVQYPPLHPDCRCYLRPEETTLSAKRQEKKEATEEIKNEEDILKALKEVIEENEEG